LAEPESITAASAEWRKAVDHVRRFVTETLIIGCALKSFPRAKSIADSKSRRATLRPRRSFLRARPRTY
jgi:hypothetical protein